MGRWRERREKRGEHTPRLWSVWVAAPIILALGCAGAYLVFRWLHTVAVPIKVPGGRPRVDSLEVIQTTLTVIAFVGALLAGLYAYRKQRLAEGDATRADDQQFADRYTKAADQLGSDQAAIRLAGVYAMARLADDWKVQRQTCVDVLCAYLRMPYQPPGEPEHRPGEDQVRKTIVSVIAAHLQPGGPPSWSTTKLNFTGAHLEAASFAEATFSGDAEFTRATFSGNAGFTGATFSGDAGFTGATFSGNAGFGEVTFSGDAEFTRATFSGNAGFGGGGDVLRRRLVRGGDVLRQRQVRGGDDVLRRCRAHGGRLPAAPASRGDVRRRCLVRRGDVLRRRRVRGGDVLRSSNVIRGCRAQRARFFGRGTL